MVGLESLHILLIGLEHLLLHPLAQAVLPDGGDDLGGVLLLGGDPAHDLVHVGEVAADGGVQFSGLHHCLADGCCILDDSVYHCWVIEDTAWHCNRTPTR